MRARMRSLPHRWSPRMRAARRLAALGERRKVVEHVAVDRARVTLLEHVGLAALQAQARGKDAGRGQSTSATRVGRPTRNTILPWRAAGPCVMTIICGGAICVMPPSMWGERLWKSMSPCFLVILDSRTVVVDIFCRQEQTPANSAAANWQPMSCTRAPAGPRSWCPPPPLQHAPA